MRRATILLWGLFVALASTTSAQNNNFQNQTAANFAPVTTGGEVIRARRVDEPDTAVKALPTAASIAAFERAAFDMLNQKRAENGEKPLAWSESLAAVARQHSQDMADKKYFSHRGLDNSMVSDRADRGSVGKWRAIGENIAFNRGYKDPIERAVQLWMESTGHRQNLLDDHWKESAVGIAVAPDGSFYFTQVFLLRK